MTHPKMSAGQPLMGLHAEQYKPKLTRSFRLRVRQTELNDLKRYIADLQLSDIVPGSMQRHFDSHGRFCGATFKNKRRKNVISV